MESTASKVSNLELDEVARLRNLLQLQQRAFLAEGPVSAQTRQDRLQRCYRMIGEHRTEIVDACHSDFGSHSRHQAQMSEVMTVMDGLERASRQVRQWMKPQRRKVMFPLGLMGSRAWVEFQPKGVVGNLSTWNFPVYTAILPLAGILAAGNRAMLKLSELTPDTSALLQRLIADYFDPCECSAVTGGPETGALFAALPFDHLMFTGGTHIGRQIMQAAASNLTPVTLELGGKSPVIVSRAYPLGKAAERIMTGKALNMGQACLAPDYCLVPREHLEAFTGHAIDYFSRLFPSILENPDYTAVINPRHYQRLQNVVQDAREKGGDVREINPAGEMFPPDPGRVCKMPMTLIVDPTDDMLAMQEELFGPVLCIRSYDTIDDCIAYINGRPRPLGLYYFGNDAAEQRRVLDHTTSGGTTLNDVMSHSSCDDLPFGGIGHSGMGHYHGYDGFRAFSHQRAVYRQTPFNLMKLSGMLPPYGDRCQRQLDKLCELKEPPAG